MLMSCGGPLDLVVVATAVFTAVFASEAISILQTRIDHRPSLTDYVGQWDRQNRPHPVKRSGVTSWAHDLEALEGGGNTTHETGSSERRTLSSCMSAKTKIDGVSRGGSSRHTQTQTVPSPPLTAHVHHPRGAAHEDHRVPRGLGEVGLDQGGVHVPRRPRPTLRRLVHLVRPGRGRRGQARTRAGMLRVRFRW